MTLLRITSSDLDLLKQGKILVRTGGPTVKIAIVDKDGRTANEAHDHLLALMNEE